MAQKFNIISNHIQSESFVFRNVTANEMPIGKLGYFNTVAMGCFSYPRVEATPIMWYLAPGMQIVTWEPCQKNIFLAPTHNISW